MENKIKKLRQKLNLTQTKLAEAVGTSQQQIQRIESGLQSVHLSLAERIAEALHSKTSVVFPGSGMPIQRARKRVGPDTGVYGDRELKKELRPVGIDLNVMPRVFRYMLDNGVTESRRLTDSEYHRLWLSVQGDHGFVLFDSLDRRVAISKDHLCFYQFGEEPFGDEVEENEDEEEYLKAYVAGGKEQLKIEITPDEPEWDGDDRIKGMLSWGMDCLEDWPGNGTDTVRFETPDDESGFLSIKHLILLDISIRWLETDAYDYVDEKECMGEEP
jgi:DNA-binding XRE family transcriptional regulator